MKAITNITYVRFALFAFVCFAFSPQARATCLQGCDTDKGNTFLGDDALSSNTTGGGNTATGWFALLRNTTGNDNTATGGLVLQYNTTGEANTGTGVAALEFNTTGIHNNRQQQYGHWLGCAHQQHDRRRQHS